MDAKQKRKPHRLKGFDYSSRASYLLTFNTIDRAKILSEIVPAGMFSPPEVKLTNYGKITENAILQIETHYPGVTVDNYVIMPDHVHLLLFISKPAPEKKRQATVSRVIHALKSITTKEIGKSIWQLDFYDVIAETEEDFLKLDQYVDNNPAAWLDKKEQEPIL